jgi:hypothetical protein
LDELSEAGVLTARVSSAGGAIRALGVEVEDYIQTGQTVAALGAIFGAVTGNQEIQQHAQLMQSVTQAAELLALVNFDQMNLQVDRLATGDIVLSDLNLISPSLRLLGEGRIAYRPGLSFWQQPLQLSLSLSARDQLGVALQHLGLLNEEPDPLGYFPLVQDFTLDGSLTNIGTSGLERLLMSSLRRR